MLTALVALALVALVVSIGSVFNVYRVRQNLQHAADASALAAADTLLGVATGFPCDRARQLADTYNVTLDTCDCGTQSKESSGADLDIARPHLAMECQVSVSVFTAIGVLTEHARAGPD